MKKVVVPGNVRHFNVPCFNCGALFEITEPDIQRSKAYQDCSIDYVKCPECGQILFLPEEKKTGAWLEPVNGKKKEV